MSDSVNEVAEDYIQRGRRHAGEALDSAGKYEAALEDQISENPIVAVLVALGVGCLIGLMLRR